MKPRTRNPYFWARFSQPSALVYAADAASRERVVAALADAVTTMYGVALALRLPAARLRMFGAGFEETYSTELRPEADQRAGQIVAANSSFYAEAACLIGRPEVPTVSLAATAAPRQVSSVTRLIKAALHLRGRRVLCRLENRTPQRREDHPHALAAAFPCSQASCCYPACCAAALTGAIVSADQKVGTAFCPNLRFRSRLSVQIVTI